MASSADRVQAFLEMAVNLPDEYFLEMYGEDTTFTVGDLRALQAERKALWAVVTAAAPIRAKIPFLTCTNETCTDPSHRALLDIIAVFDAARADLAKLEKE